MLRHVALVRTDVSEEYLHHLGEEFLCSVCWLLVTDNIVPSSQILVTLMMEVLHSSKMSVLARTTQHNIPKDSIIQFFFFVYMSPEANYKASMSMKNQQQNYKSITKNNSTTIPYKIQRDGIYKICTFTMVMLLCSKKRL
jgi:hypothetical protein